MPFLGLTVRKAVGIALISAGGLAALKALEHREREREQEQEQEQEYQGGGEGGGQLQAGEEVTHHHQGVPPPPSPVRPRWTRCANSTFECSSCLQTLLNGKLLAVGK
jgi:hypothetical protein